MDVGQLTSFVIRSHMVWPVSDRRRFGKNFKNTGRYGTGTNTLLDKLSSLYNVMQSVANVGDCRFTHLSFISTRLSHVMSGVSVKFQLRCKTIRRLESGITMRAVNPQPVDSVAVGLTTPSETWEQKTSNGVRHPLAGGRAGRVRGWTTCAMRRNPCDWAVKQREFAAVTRPHVPGGRPASS